VIILNLDVLRLFSSFALLHLVILNDQVLGLDLRRRAVDHVFDDELSIAKFADAASQSVVIARRLFRSEQSGLLHTLFATGLPAERTVRVLEFFLILPRVLTCVACRCVLIFSLADGLVHEEYCLELIEHMLTLPDQENSTCFKELIYSLVFACRVFLELIVESDTFSE